IHAHYEVARDQLKLDHREPQPGTERHGGRVIVPAGYRDIATARAIDHALTISNDVTVVHFATGETREDSRRKWRAWVGDDVKVAVIGSPYREVVSPLLDLLERWRRWRRGRAVLAVACSVAGIGLGSLLGLATRHPVAANSASLQPGQPRPAPLTRQSAPPFTLVDQNGATVSLAAQRGRVVLLTFMD